MRVVHDRRRTRRSPDTLTVDDLLTAEAFDTDGLLGREYPIDSAHESGKFLPPPRVGQRRRVPPPREPEGRLAKAAKLAGLTTAASLLVGAVVASSLVTRTRSDQTARPNPVPPPITGAAALGGFALQGNGRPLREESRPPAATTPAQIPVTGANPPAPSSSPASATKAPDRPDDGVDLVKQFYQRMASQRPQDALAMLSPEVAGDQPGDLVRAWSSMSKVQVDTAKVQPDGSVIAVVTMLRQDGARLRVTQQFGLTGDGDTVISRVVLLSAEQL
ncbi:hypothetical protein [Amycolatopsis pigmentata]|uniref:Uncharacterized protein n=1 Tax=Amycolatopsis pigmentata TaxID=450801 RepID=A0ABW5G702_9PSEU